VDSLKIKYLVNQTIDTNDIIYLYIYLRYNAFKFKKNMRFEVAVVGSILILYLETL
jgi:hypothetical protein